MVRIPEIVGFGGWFYGGFTAFDSWNSCAGFGYGQAGKFLENFSEKFLENIFGARKNLEKILCGPDDFLLMVKGV